MSENDPKTSISDSPAPEDLRQHNENLDLEISELRKDKLALEVKRLRRALKVRWFEFALKVLSTIAAVLGVYYALETGLLHLTEKQLADSKDAYADLAVKLTTAQGAKETAEHAAEAADQRAVSADQRTAAAVAAKIKAQEEAQTAIKQAEQAEAAKTQALAERDKAKGDADAAQLVTKAAVAAQTAAESARAVAEKKRDGAEAQVKAAEQKLTELQAQTDAIKMELYWKAPLRHRSIVVSYSTEWESQYRAFRKLLNAYLDPLLEAHLIVLRDNKFDKNESIGPSVDWVRLNAVLARLATEPENRSDTNQIFFRGSAEIDEAVQKLAEKVLPVDAKWGRAPISSRELGLVDVVISLK